MKRLSLIFLSLFVNTGIALSQCAMCRTQVVNNVSHGETFFAAGLNTGILYLFFTPYVLLAVIIYLWFKNSKYNERKRTITSRMGG